MNNICLFICLLFLLTPLAYAEDGDSMNVTLLASVDEAGSDVILHNNYVYMDNSIYNIANPSSPTYIGEIDHNFEPYKLAIQGNYLYATDYDINVFDISDPENPVFRSSYETRDAGYDIIVRGNYAYIADYDGFAILNISDPENISEEGYVEVTGYSLTKIAVSGDYAYLLSSDDLYIYNISNPSSPFLTGSCDHGGASEAVVVLGNIAFVGDYGYMGVIDISDPENPILSDSWVGDGAMGIKIIGNFAYMASSYAGVTIANIVDPYNMIIVGYYDTPGRMIEIDVHDDIIYATGSDFFHILDCSSATDDSPPDVFSLLTPANNTTIADDEVDLTWSESSDDVYKYVLYTATNSSFTQDVDSVDVDAEDTEYNFDDLENNTTYWWKVRAQNANSSGTWSTQTWSFAVQQSDVPEHGQLPQEYAVTAVYPNPFNPVLNIEITLPTPEKVQINVFNVLGEFVKRVVFDLHSSGHHIVELDANNLASGVYYVSVKIPGKLNHFEKAVLLK